MQCRLYINQTIHPQQHITLTPEQGHYLRSVMRLASGDPVILFNGQGGEYQATIEVLSRQESSLLVEHFRDIDRELPHAVHIVQAACRSEKIDTILQKGTELGAASFTIVRSERSSLKLDGAKLEKRLQRWQKIIIEAAEQSERTKLPTLSWSPKLQHTLHREHAYLLHPESSRAWSDLRHHIIAAHEVTFAIGPEGGWSRRDIEILQQQGFTNLTFGPRIMRTETAAPALLAAIQSLL